MPDAQTMLSTARAPYNRPLRLVVAGLAAGAGGVLAASSLVRAADDAGVLAFLKSETRPFVTQRRDEPQRTAFVALSSTKSTPRAAAPTQGFSAPRPPSSRFAVLSPASTSQPPAAAATHGIGSERSICVRACDGYAFPLGNLSSRADIPGHKAGCAAACPGSRTLLYTLPAGSDDIRRAVSLSGQPYSRLPTAGLNLKRHVEHCSCAGGLPTRSLLASDRTLRGGDVVAAREGAAAVITEGLRRPQLVDFREPGVVTPSVRRAVERLTEATRRETAQAEFRRVMRTRHAAAQGTDGARRVRLADATGGFTVLAAQAGFTQVRVVVPSPYVAR